MKEAVVLCRFIHTLNLTLVALYELIRKCVKVQQRHLVVIVQMYVSLYTLPSYLFYCIDMWCQRSILLSVIPHFDLIRETTVDYMHLVLLGVCRQLLKLWLDSKHHKKLWYIGNKLTELDCCLCILKPPSEVKRTPHTI